MVNALAVIGAVVCAAVAASLIVKFADKVGKTMMEARLWRERVERERLDRIKREAAWRISLNN